MSDYYQLLGVDREAGSEEIKRAYRRLARQYHPDVNGNNPEAAERFKEISKAYSVLSDPDKRQRYDAYGEAGIDGFAGPGGDPFAGFGASFDDLLGAFFGFVIARQIWVRNSAELHPAWIVLAFLSYTMSISGSLGRSRSCAIFARRSCSACCSK